jgi:hypothetical protein
MQATLPPATTPPAATAVSPASTIKGASATLTLASNDLRLVLTKARRSESALVRYQVFLKYDVDRKLSEGADPTVQCGWRLRAYLQRSICFWSMSGLFSCTDAESRELAEAETGAADLGSDPSAPACDLRFAPAHEARDRLIETLKTSAQARFDEDYTLNVKPQLVASGVKITRPKT